MRRSPHHTQKTNKHGWISNTVSIRDRRKELTDHERFSLDTDIKVYFCDPQGPWQRGLNENTHGLLSQHLPTGMDLSNVHQHRPNVIARRLNERPGKTLDFGTPAERFAQCVASTH
jgi:IS30 family transposase